MTGPRTLTAQEGSAADLVDAILAIAREISTDSPPQGVPELTPMEGHVLRFIGRHPGSTAKAVSAASRLHSSNLSAVLRGLESKGLIERTQDGEDARIIRLSATDRAETHLHLIRAAWAARIGETRLRPEHVASALTALQSLEADLSREGVSGA